jgi:IS30 family transposase
MGGFLREMKRKDRYGREYSYWVAVKSYRDKKTGKVRHKVLKTFGRLTEKEAENLKALWQLKEMGKDALVTTGEDIQVGASYEYLSIQILHRIFRLLELDKIFSYDRSVMVDLADIAEVLIIFL